MRRGKGFTFIELMVTMMFMAICYFYIMDLYKVILKRVEAAEVMDVAVDLCSETMERLKNERLTTADMLKEKKRDSIVKRELSDRVPKSQWRIAVTFTPYIPGQSSVTADNPDRMAMIRVSAIRQILDGNEAVVGEFVEYELVTLYQDVRTQ